MKILVLIAIAASVIHYIIQTALWQYWQNDFISYIHQFAVNKGLVQQGGGLDIPAVFGHPEFRRPEFPLLWKTLSWPFASGSIDSNGGAPSYTGKIAQSIIWGLWATFVLRGAFSKRK